MLRLAWDNEAGRARLQTTEDGALDDNGNLETLVLLSLFTDAEATPQEIAQAGLQQQRGWWADADSVRPSGMARRGSKLWLLSRGKLNQAARNRARDYARESLQWLVDRGIAASVDVVVTSPRAGWLAFSITITRPNAVLPPFTRLWELKLTNAIP